jgi:hypothetical protein
MQHFFYYSAHAESLFNGLILFLEKDRNKGHVRKSFTYRCIYCLSPLR